MTKATSGLDELCAYCNKPLDEQTVYNTCVCGFKGIHTHCALEISNALTQSVRATRERIPDFKRGDRVKVTPLPAQHWHSTPRITKTGRILRVNKLSARLAMDEGGEATVVLGRLQRA